MSPTQSGEQILVPLFNAEAATRLVHVKWSQDAIAREADYYWLTVDNITTGVQALSRSPSVYSSMH